MAADRDSPSGRGFAAGRGVRRLTPLIVALAAVSLWWLQHPPRTPAAYREQSVKTLESLRSHVETARLWSLELVEGDATRAATAVTYKEAASGAQSAASGFESWIPPRGTASIRSSVSAAASEVNDTLGRLHIASERDEWQAVPAARDDLERLARRLDEEIEDLRR